ncbi:MAG: tyrosine-type recombinase/integrase [Ignavibacteriaceae bacterium]
MPRYNAIGNSPTQNKGSRISIKDDRSVSLLKFYADYYEYVDLKYSSKYLKSITTLFNHVFKYYGKKRSLQEIEYREWDRFFLHLTQKCPGGAPVYLRTAKAALNKAIEWDLITENPLTKIKLPKRQQEEQMTLKASEIHDILHAVSNPQIKALIKTAFYTGLRRSELVGLKVKHVDLETGFLQVGDEELITKSRKIREVALCSQVIELLSDISIDKQPDDLLFGKTKKFPYSADYVSRVFMRAVRRKQLNKRIHFHTCRHSYITHLANGDIPLPAVQMLAGHSNITTTMRYVHVDRIELLKSVNVLNMLN